MAVILLSRSRTSSQRIGTGGEPPRHSNGGARGGDLERHDWCGHTRA